MREIMPTRAMVPEPSPDIPESWPLRWRHWWDSGPKLDDHYPEAGMRWELMRIMPDFDKGTMLRLVEGGAARRSVIAGGLAGSGRQVHQEIAAAIAENNRAYARALNLPKIVDERGNVVASSQSGSYDPIPNPA